MNTLEMLKEAEKTGKTYIVNDMRYSNERGFHDKDNKSWPAECFHSINDIIYLKGWKLLDVTKKMTLKEIEDKLGHRIELISE
jgi:hypothetical protein